MSWALGAMLIAFGTVVIVAIIAFVVGLLIGFLLVTPARIGMDRSSREQHREQENLETELRDLRQKNAQLEAEHAGTVAERDHLRQQVAQMHATAPAGVGAAQDGDRAARPTLQPQQPAADANPDGSQESLGDRVRGFFSGSHDGNQRRDDETLGADQPPAPTA